MGWDHLTTKKHPGKTLVVIIRRCGLVIPEPPTHSLPPLLHLLLYSAKRRLRQRRGAKRARGGDKERRHLRRAHGTGD